MSFRKALIYDLNQLDKLFETNSVKNGGFLFCESSRPDKDNLDNIFVVDDGNNLIAYLSYCESIHPDMLDVEMTQPADFHTEKFIYIKQVVVKKELQKAGIGTYLYKRFFNQYPGYIFYSHVSVFNQASIALHRKTGFSKVGMFRKDFFNGEGNYQSDFLRRLPQEDVYNGSSRRIMPESLMCRTLYGLHAVESEAERGA